MDGNEDWSCSVPVKRGRRRKTSSTEIGTNVPTMMLLGAKSETIPCNCVWSEDSANCDSPVTVDVESRNSNAISTMSYELKMTITRN